jgi:hypothetical protein
VRRAYLILVLSSLVVAASLAALARATHPTRDTTAAAAVHHGIGLQLKVENGLTEPLVSTVRKDWLVLFEVVNRDRVRIRVSLTGYEDRVSSGPIAPDSTWRVRFVADRPGDDFEWQVNGHPAGRFIVMGSHLDEGRR